MGDPAKRMSVSYLWVIKGEKQSKSKFILYLFLAALISLVYIVYNQVETVEFPDTGINWNNPPCSPADLPSNWKDITHEIVPNPHSSFYPRRWFRYEGTRITPYDIVIAYDPFHLKGSQKSHWHRYNPYIEKAWEKKNKKNQMVDKDNRIVNEGSNRSHIYTPKECN